MDSRSSSLAMRPPPLPPAAAVAAAAVAAAAAALAVVKGTNQLAELDSLGPPLPVSSLSSQPSIKNDASFFDDHWGMGYGGMPSHAFSSYTIPSFFS